MKTLLLLSMCFVSVQPFVAHEHPTRPRRQTLRLSRRLTLNDDEYTSPEIRVVPPNYHLRIPQIFLQDCEEKLFVRHSRAASALRGRSTIRPWNKDGFVWMERARWIF